MRVAIVHDWLNQNGGAERVLEELHRLFPDAPVYTSMYAPDRVPAEYRGWDIRTSYMQHLPLVKRHHQPFLPLYPSAFAGFDFSGYDVVVSNSSGFCHGITVPPGVAHLNYCLTPPRFLYATDGYLQRERITGPAKWVLPPIIQALRRWDVQSVRGVTRFVAISQAVQQRIRTLYGRESDIIYPPVDTAQFAIAPQVGDFYFIAARLVPYKRVDLAVRAFTALGLPLWVAGDGRDRAALEALAGPNVRFLGRVSFDRLRELYATCRAFLFPGEEDFGIAPVEALASGRPVIAYAAGGALDYVEDGVTGTLFHQQTPEALADAVRRTDTAAFAPQVIRERALRYDTAVFARQMLTAVEAMAPQPQAVR